VGEIMMSYFSAKFGDYSFSRLGFVVRTDRQNQARFPFPRNRLRCVRCVNENRKKRKRFDRSFLLAGAWLAFVAVFVYATHATQAIAFAFEWKPGFTHRRR